MPDMPITKKRLPLRQVEALERIAAALEKIAVSPLAGNPLDWPIEVGERPSETPQSWPHDIDASFGRKPKVTGKVKVSEEFL